MELEPKTTRVGLLVPHIMIDLFHYIISVDAEETSSFQHKLLVAL